MNKVILMLLVFFYSCFNVYSGTIDPNNSDKKYLEYGEQFNYIGQLLITRINDNDLYAGSAVAYSDNIVITAAHLFKDYNKAIIIINNKTIKLDSIICHSEYNYDEFGKHDIAICVLESPIELDWYPELYSDLDETDKLCSLSGYGSSGDFLNGVSKSDGLRRAGSNFIDNCDAFALFCSPSDKDKTTSLEFLIAPGDSGGGLFIGNKLAGIHSGTIEYKTQSRLSKYGAISVHTRISIYKDWIEKNINKIKDTKNDNNIMVIDND